MEYAINVWVRVFLGLLLAGTFGVMVWAISGEIKAMDNKYQPTEEDE